MPTVNGRLTCARCGEDLGDAEDPYRDPTCATCERDDRDEPASVEACAHDVPARGPGYCLKCGRHRSEFAKLVGRLRWNTTETSEGRVSAAATADGHVRLKVSQWRGPSTRAEWVELTPYEAKLLAAALSWAAVDAS